MRITVVVSLLPVRGSGSEVRCKYLYESLLTDHQVTLLYSGLETNFSDVDPRFKIVHCPRSISNIVEKVINIASGKIPYIEAISHTTISPLAQSVIKNAQLIIYSESESFFLLKKHKQLITGKTILDSHNVDSDRFATSVISNFFIFKPFRSFLIALFHRYEKQVLTTVDHIIACSVDDANQFSKVRSQTDISVVPNGVDCEYFAKITPVQNQKITFMGLLSYGPNIDALRFYLHEIHPKVKVAYPAYTFTIIGKNPQPELIAFIKSDSSVELEGFVPDVRTILANSHVCVCPLQFGSGTRLKLLEYMAAGIPVVSTEVGAEGIEVIDKQHLLLSNTAEGFKDAISKLFTDKELCVKLTQNARKLVEDKYSWKIISQSFVDICAQIV